MTNQVTSEDLLNFIDERIGKVNDKTIPSSIEKLINPSSFSKEALLLISEIISFIRPKNLVEFGSGVSTQYLNILQNEGMDFNLTSIDHEENFYFQTLLRLETGEKKTSQLQLRLCPLQQFRFKLKLLYAYNLQALESDKNKFDFVIIDGPPSYRFGREGVLYSVYRRLSDNCVIILDDAHRPPEKTAMSNWKKVWGEEIIVVKEVNIKKGLAIILLKNPTKVKKIPFSFKEIIENFKIELKI